MTVIDSLKEEYEEHCRLAVQETKRYGNIYQGQDGRYRQPPG
jgi:hypothetical protein